MNLNEPAARRDYIHNRHQTLIGIAIGIAGTHLFYLRPQKAKANDHQTVEQLVLTLRLHATHYTRTVSTVLYRPLSKIPAHKSVSGIVILQLSFNFLVCSFDTLSKKVVIAIMDFRFDDGLICHDNSLGFSLRPLSSLRPFRRLHHLRRSCFRRRDFPQ